MYTDHRARFFCGSHKHMSMCCLIISVCPVCGDALGPADVNQHMSKPHEARAEASISPLKELSTQKALEEEETKEMWPCSYCQEVVDRNEYPLHVQGCKQMLDDYAGRVSRSSSGTKRDYWCSMGWRHPQAGHVIYATAFYCRAQKRYFCEYHHHTNECCNAVVEKFETTLTTPPVTTSAPKEQIRFVKVLGDQD